MDEIVNILLGGDKFMPEMHLRHFVFIIKFADQLLEAKEFKNSKKREIKGIFMKSN